MRRLCFFSVLILLFSVICVGCTQKAEGPKPLLVWSGMDTEFPTLVSQCKRFEEETGIKVELLKVPFSNLNNKFLIAAPAGLGPDILVGPHDWIGYLCVADLLAPFPQGTIDESRFVPVSLEAARFNNQVYMAPLCMECLALFRNTDLMPKRPETLDELIEEAQKIQKDSNNRIKGFYFESKQCYFAAPFIMADGGYLLGKDKSGNYNPTDIGIDNEGAILGAEFLRDLTQKYQLIGEGATEDLSKSLFVEKNPRENRAAVIIEGPWFLQGVKNSGVHYAIDPFPLTASGQRPKPLLGLQGLMLNKYSERSSEAAKLIAYLTNDENMTEMSKASGRPPVTKGALKMCADDADTMAFAKVCEDGVPMPSHPAVAQLWDPLRQSLELIITGRVQPAPELRTTHDRIVKKIELMLE